MRKSQAATEFLTTYAWAFLVILSSISALYYFGFLDFSKFSPQQCIFSPQFPCSDFVIKEDLISIRLNNDIGEDLNVELLDITTEDGSSVPCTATNPIVPYVWPVSNNTDFMYSCTPGGNLQRGERAELIFTFVYYSVNTPSQTRHTVKGKLRGGVTT